jgi:hypothetical protein
MVGGAIRGLLDKKAKKDESYSDNVETGILYASGLIAGEGLMGVILAIFAYFEINVALKEGTVWGQIPALLIFILLALSLTYIVFKKSKKPVSKETATKM